MSKQPLLMLWKFTRFYIALLMLFLLPSCKSLSSAVSIENTLLPTTDLPSDTPTLTEVPTTKPLAATSTQIFSPTETEPAPGNRLFIWKPFYGYLDLEQDHPFPTQPGGNVPRGKHPYSAIALGFSAFTDQIGYLVENGSGKMELWVSDLMLTDSQPAWVDEHNELGYIKESIDQVFEIKWGAGDNFIFILRYPTLMSDAEAVFFFGLHDYTMLHISSPSGYLVTSPQTQQLALGYETSNGFVLLEQNGGYQEIQSLPVDYIPVLDIAFSPDKQKVLYSFDERIYLRTDIGDVDLNIGYIPSITHDQNRVTLQWAQTGKRVLIYGIDWSGKYCPYERYQELPCWQVIDVLSGNHLLGESKFTDAVATISPDGTRVAYFVYEPGTPSGIIANIDTRRFTTIIDSAFSAVHWSSK